MFGLNGESSIYEMIDQNKYALSINGKRGNLLNVLNIYHEFLFPIKNNIMNEKRVVHTDGNSFADVHLRFG